MRPSDEPVSPNTLTDSIAAVPLNLKSADASSAATGPVSEGDAQRRALTELIQLSTATAAAESSIERDRQRATDDENRSFGDLNFRLDQRHKELSDEGARKHAELLQQLDNQYQHEANRLRSKDRSARQKAEGEKQDVEEKLKSAYDHAVWMADSVHELANNQITGIFQQKKDEHETAHAAINADEVKAAELVQKYGVALPLGAPAVEVPSEIALDADATLARYKIEIEDRLLRLNKVPLAFLFVGLRPYLILVLVVLAAVIAVQATLQTTEPAWKPLAIFAGGALGVSSIVGIFVRLWTAKKIREIHEPLRVDLILARKAVDQRLANAGKKRVADIVAADAARLSEIQGAKGEFSPQAAKALKARDLAFTSAQAESSRSLSQLDQLRSSTQGEHDERHRRQINDLDHRREREVREIKTRHETRLAQIQQESQSRYSDLEKSWSNSLVEIQKPMGRDEASALTPVDWNDPAWKTWSPPRKFAAQVRFGEMQVDLKQIAENVPRRLKLPPAFSLPALLAFPAQGSILINADHAGRNRAIRVLQMLIARILTGLPSGRARFTLIDPVGLGQNFAGFMHLADFDEALVSGRIWTTQDQIEQRLANLTEHMETVIQKYLRNEFANIDQYNAQAGELSEPYRFLVIADLPVNFTTESFRRLNAIATSGPRCGVYTLVHRDTRIPLPSGAHLDELKAKSVNLTIKDDRFVWEDAVFRPLPLKVDEPPSEAAVTELLQKIGAAAKEAKRVEVAFENIAPSSDKFWTGSTTSELDVPIGRLGANRLQNLKLGRGVAQHVLIAGKTGSGKSTLLHAMITNAAMWYSPDEVELYLIDFKKGVEFKTYASHALPHARAIAVESDREFGLSVLQRLDVELSRRGEIFRKAGVQDLGSYRQIADRMVIPRTLLMIDEFQEFFSEDDKLAQEASLLIDRLVRQGRAFGIHVLLGSQTIGGAGGLPRSTLGQMAVRIALQTSEADSQLILGDNNSAARLLTRPGEAIYNDAGGLVEGNSPFQVAWLSDERRDRYLQEISSRAAPYIQRFGLPIVFEGNAPADIERNQLLLERLEPGGWKKKSPPSVLAWLGEPVAIKEPTSAALRRQSGVNLLIVGQQDEQAMALLQSAVVSIAAQQSTTQAQFYLFDGTPADSPLAGRFAKLASVIPHAFNVVDWRATGSTLDALSKLLVDRQENEQAGGPSVYVIVNGLQRYRMLRKQEEDYSFSTSDDPKKANPAKQFAELLREGPALGIHVLAWADTLVTLDRTFDRGAMREFDYRVLFQMSASDSSSLIDSPAGNKLSFFRALIFSEEQGMMERFRPYAMPDDKWLKRLKAAFSRRDETDAVTTKA